jgi:hypothetical protein
MPARQRPPRPRAAALYGVRRPTCTTGGIRPRGWRSAPWLECIGRRTSSGCAAPARRHGRPGWRGVPTARGPSPANTRLEPARSACPTCRPGGMAGRLAHRRAQTPDWASSTRATFFPALQHVQPLLADTPAPALPDAPGLRRSPPTGSLPTGTSRGRTGTTPSPANTTDLTCRTTPPAQDHSQRLPGAWPEPRRCRFVTETSVSPTDRCTTGMDDRREHGHRSRARSLTSAIAVVDAGRGGALAPRPWQEHVRRAWARPLPLGCRTFCPAVGAARHGRVLERAPARALMPCSSAVTVPPARARARPSRRAGARAGRSSRRRRRGRAAGASSPRR